MAKTTDAELPQTAGLVEHVFFAPPGEVSGRVVLLLAMTAARPQDSQNFLAAAASDGHFAVGVAYDTPGYPDASCVDSPAGDGPCNAPLRARTVFGDVEPPLPETWETPDSVMFRADRLLHFLMDLDDRLAALFPDRVVDWRRVHVVAHRDATALAIEMARRVPVASVGLLAGTLTEGDARPADVPTDAELRFAARDDDPRLADLRVDWAVAGAQSLAWSVSAPTPASAAWIIDTTPFAPLEGQFDSLLLDQRLNLERIHALRPLWRHLMGQSQWR